MVKKTTDVILREAKNFYMLQSMTHKGNDDYRELLKSLALVTMFLDQNKDEKYAIRDTRNFMYKLQKDISGDPQKKIFKEMLRIIK